MSLGEDAIAFAYTCSSPTPWLFLVKRAPARDRHTPAACTRHVCLRGMNAATGRWSLRECRAAEPLAWAPRGIRVRSLLPSSPAGWVALLLFGAGILLRIGLMIAYRPAFLGIPDSGTYMQAAHIGLFSDPVDPIGYALFLRVVHFVTGRVFAITLLQHTMGVATAWLLFDLGRRTRSAWVGLVPAAAVLLNGLQLWTEHSPLSDPLFTFLCAVVLWLAVRSREPGLWRLPLLGATLGAATVVRSVGLLLIPLTMLWLLWATPGQLVPRAWRAAVPLVLSLAVVFGYAEIQYHHSGVFGFTESDGRIEYAVAAPFAQCSQFTPPPGTRALCQSIPPARRGNFNQYLWGFPEGATSLPLGGRAAVSPAWRLFGAMPGGNSELGAFGRAAILHQPGAFIAQTARNFSYYWRASARTFIDDAADLQPGVDQIAASYYGVTPGVTTAGFGALKAYADVVEIQGIPLLVLLVLSLLALAAPRPRERAVGVLAAAAGWLLLAGPAMVASDARYALPGIGPLALAAAIGVAGVADRVAARRTRAG